MHSWRNWIACQPPTLKVVGSIPAGCTMKKAPSWAFFHALFAIGAQVCALCLIPALGEEPHQRDTSLRREPDLRLQGAGDLPALAAAELHGAKRLFCSRKERFRAQKVFLLFHAPMIAHRAAAVKGKRGATRKRRRASRALKSVDKRLIAAYNLVRLRERGKI